MLDHIIRSGLASVQKVKIPRAGGRSDERDGLLVTIQGNAAMQQPSPTALPGAATPCSPQPSHGNDAGPCDGGAPKGPRNVPRGSGGNAGETNVGGTPGAHAPKNEPEPPGSIGGVKAAQLPAPASSASAPTARSTEAVLNGGDVMSTDKVLVAPPSTTSPHTPTAGSPPTAPDPSAPSAPASPAGSTDLVDDFTIPPFLPASSHEEGCGMATEKQK